MKIEELKKFLEKVASQEALDDNEDFCARDYAGGNFDDAFYGGQLSGEISLARAILATYFN